MLANADKNGSSPKVLAETILKAVKSNKPKTRYATGSGSTIVLFLRSILSDRLFDKFILNMMNR